MFMQIYGDNIQCSRNSLHVHANCSKYPPSPFPKTSDNKKRTCMYG